MLEGAGALLQEGAQWESINFLHAFLDGLKAPAPWCRWDMGDYSAGCVRTLAWAGGVLNNQPNFFSERFEKGLSFLFKEPRIETRSARRRGLYCSELGRISSISITPATLSRKRFMQELMVMEQKRIMEGSRPTGALTSTVISKVVYLSRFKGNGG